ncbi:hypothetical protein ACNKHM_08460 [Shigella sonnei]
MAKVAVLGLAQARDPQLAASIEENVPPFRAPWLTASFRRRRQEALQEIADQLILQPVRHCLRTVPSVGN